MIRTSLANRILIGAALVLTGAGTFFALSSVCQAGAQEITQVQPAAAEIESLPDITADGYIVPVRQATLSTITGGRVAAVEVIEGQQVQAGDMLLALEDRAQREAVAQAEANLAIAKAGLAQLTAGPRAEELAQAEAAVLAAQARLERLANGPTNEQMASARQAVAVAQANLERAQAGPSPEQLTAADATLAQAEAAVKQAQAAYDQVAYRSDIGALPESLRLEQATNEYTRAQASYQNLANGATPAEIKVYQEQVAQAQAALNEVLAGANPADISGARAEVAQAQAGLGLLKAGSTTEEIAAAEAQVLLAEASLEQARAALAETVLRAPFAGVIAAVDVAPGEYLAPGAAAVVLGDTSRWQMETDNLTEQDVVKLAEGQTVDVRVDALPDNALQGTIERIQPVSEIKRGDVTYRVVVSLTEPDVPLRWGLTAVMAR